MARMRAVHAAVLVMAKGRDHLHLQHPGPQHPGRNAQNAGGSRRTPYRVYACEYGQAEEYANQVIEKPSE